MINLGAEHENLYPKVYLILKNMIMVCKLLPGDKIPQINRLNNFFQQFDPSSVNPLCTRA